MNETEFHQVRVDCPICSAIRKINIPTAIINTSAQLTTISIPKGRVCEHHFQLFLDKNFKVRGYQKVDYEFEKEKSSESIQKEKKNKDPQLFNDLILEGNYLKYSPTFITADKLVKEQKKENPPEIQGERTLEQLYEEFWEIIDDDNEEFQEFIIQDKRRKNLPKIFL